MGRKKEYYTASAALAVLQVDYNTLRRLVASGAIERYVPPGKRQGLYLKSDVDIAAKAMQRSRDEIRIINMEGLHDNGDDSRNPFDRKGSSAIFASG